MICDSCMCGSSIRRWASDCCCRSTSDSYGAEAVVEPEPKSSPNQRERQRAPENQQHGRGNNNRISSSSDGSTSNTSNGLAPSPARSSCTGAPGVLADRRRCTPFSKTECPGGALKPDRELRAWAHSFDRAHFRCLQLALMKKISAFGLLRLQDVV